MKKFFIAFVLLMAVVFGSYTQELSITSGIYFSVEDNSAPASYTVAPVGYTKVDLSVPMFDFIFFDTDFTLSGKKPDGNGYSTAVDCHIGGGFYRKFSQNTKAYMGYHYYVATPNAMVTLFPDIYRKVAGVNELYFKFSTTW